MPAVVVPTLAQSTGPLTPRVYYASKIRGVSLDCDFATGGKIGGGTATDNAALINAVLATATATSPIHLVIDGPSLMGDSLIIPTAGHVTVEGIGWSSGFRWKPGSNCCPIRTANVGSTNLQIYNAVHPSGTQSIQGRNVRLANFYADFNRGTYPNGLVGSNANDGTITFGGGAGTPDVRGLPDKFFYTGLNLLGLDKVEIDHLWVRNSPSYHIDLYHCTNVWIDDCRVEADSVNSTNTDGIHLNGGCNNVWIDGCWFEADSVNSTNTDGIHLNGGCNNVWIDGCWFATGDDPIAVNLEEGDNAGGGDVFVSNCLYANCATGGRVFGSSVATRRVSFSNIKGTVQYWGLQIGNENFSPVGTDTNHSVAMIDWDVRVTNPSDGACLLWISNNAGLVEMRGCKVVEPTAAHPIIRVGWTGAAAQVSALRVADCSVHRNSSGSAAVHLLASANGSVANLSIAGFAVSHNGSFAALPSLLTVSSPATIGRLWVADLDPAHVTALIDNPAQLTAKLGPGLTASGF